MKTEEELRKVDYDQILDHIGQFGTWQKRVHFLLWLVSAAGGLAVVVFSFTAYNLSYSCKNPYCDLSQTTIDYSPGLCQYYSIGKFKSSTKTGLKKIIIFT